MAKRRRDKKRWHIDNENYFRTNSSNNDLKYVSKDAANAKNEFVVGSPDHFMKKNKSRTQHSRINNINEMKISEINTKDYNLRITR